MKRNMSNMNNMNNIMMKLFMVIMLMMFSMGAYADVKVLFGENGDDVFSGKGGTIEVSQEPDEKDETKVIVTLTVTPKKNYSISKDDIKVYAVLPASVRSTRGLEISNELTLDGKDPQNLSEKRDYTVTIDSKLALWIRTATFTNLRKDGEITVTYHIINLGRLNDNGQLTTNRTEALKFTSDEGTITLPAQFKSPLATNWKFYAESDVTYNSTTRAYTFSDDPSLHEGSTVTADADVYITYEIDEEAFSTVNIHDGGVYRIKADGNYYLQQTNYNNDPNTSFTSNNTLPTTANYCWKFNIVDPYQITIQTKSGNSVGSYGLLTDFYLCKGGNYGDIRLRKDIATAKDTKVWSYGLLPGGTEGTYRIIITDGATANENGMDEYGHGYINRGSGKSRYNQYSGSSYNKCDLTFTPLEYNYTYNIVDKDNRIAIKYTTTTPELVGRKLTSYTDIPEAIRSPYLSNEEMTFYSFSGAYDVANLKDENLTDGTPFESGANIYVRYTTDHLNDNDKILHLQGTRIHNIKVNGDYIYDNSGTLAHESTDANKKQLSRIWYISGQDPYAVQIQNAASPNRYLEYNTATGALTLTDSPTNYRFILLEGSEEGNINLYEQMELVAATGTTDLYRITRDGDAFSISTSASGDAVQVQAYSETETLHYYLIDKSKKLIEGPIDFAASRLSLPDEWISPLVSAYHYYTTSGLVGDTYNPSDEVTQLSQVSEGDNIYVTYDVGDAIDIEGGKTYMLRYLYGQNFKQENESDVVMDEESKGEYPYNNGDFNLYVYGKNQWNNQLAKGASTRSRWLWYLISNHNDVNLGYADPYHVIVKSYQNQKIKISDTEEYEGHCYLRTYKPNDAVGVITSVSYENPTYSAAYNTIMPDDRVNGNPTEYMIIGSSLDKMKLITYNKYGDVRYTVDKFEQYWKNNPTVYNILKDAGHTVTEGKSVNEELSDPEKAVLTSAPLNWHSYQVWANAANWSSNPKATKSLAEGWHWFQTISMGSGEFTMEEVALEPQVILLDKHGWEIVRIPLYLNYNKEGQTFNAAGLKAYSSPMVSLYKWYTTAPKETGYHKYKVAGSPTFTSNSLDVEPTGMTAGKEPDFYVTYDVESVYANTFTGSSTEDELPNATFLLKQNGNWIKTTNGTDVSSVGTQPGVDDNSAQWYLKPNFNIDREMGYRYKGESGAQSEAKSKTETDNDNYSAGRNGFDPYNLQIQNKAYPLRYLTANTTGSALSGGAWVGTSTVINLQNQGTKQTAAGYDQTTLNITNATFMIVGDAAGNMRLMPRFDNNKVMTDFTTLSTYTSAANVSQTLTLQHVTQPTVVHNSGELLDMNGHYLLASDFSFASGFASLGTSTTPFTGTIDGQLNVITAPSVPLVAFAEGATIKNIILDNVSISSAVTFGDNKKAIGAIACVATGTTRIYNCGILATNSTVKTNNDGYTEITSCSSSVGGTADYVGGLVGFLDGEARVINCYSYANITGGTEVGGIVGHNNVATASNNLKTMVMNCMYYGNITGSTNKAPIYNGTNIVNKDANGVGNYNYFYSEASYAENLDIQAPNCALMAEGRFLQRFEFFRHLLNSHRELAGWWATGIYSKSDMAKWVLEPSQIGTATPYPILKPAGYYPSVVNIDAENATTQTERNKGGKLGTLTVNIQMGSGGAVFGPPTGAEITTSSLTLNITDKDPDHFNFNYYKVQLPYYNDVGTNNYRKASDGTSRVVTGWKIVSITGGTEGSFTTGDDATASVNAETGKVTLTTPYNFADRHCTNKDLYGTDGSNRIFSQGAYWDVPENVTAITIEPYWAKAAYVADTYADVVYNTGMGTKYDVPNVGGGQIYNNNTNYNIAGEQQKVFTTISNAVENANGLNKPTSNTVNDYAVVLVGNVHQYYSNNAAIGGSYKYTVTSIDLDGDNEPDYSFMLRDDGRNNLHPVKWDFLNLVGLGMAQKSTGGTGSYNLGILCPKGWFETTNTALFRVTQLEFEFSGKVDPLIVQGGVMEQWVSSNQKGTSDAIPYYHVGGNVWFKEFHLGCHQDKTIKTKHSPVSVTGGDYDEFYLTGLYRSDVTSKEDNAECYINGGRFGIVCGAAMEGLGKSGGADNTGNITWQIQNADIKEFYAGGITAAAGRIVEGNLTTVIEGGYIKKFCGGPKFGDMNTGKTVTTTANGTIFDTFFGAGYGGNSYSRRAPANRNNVVNLPGPGKLNNVAKDFNSWNDWVKDEYKQDYNSSYGGVSTQISYQFLPMSSNTDNVARLFVEYVKFSLAKTRGVTSTLTGCTINKNFYGGGNLGKVEGDVTSTLTNCTVKGNVFGAGFSAQLPTVTVDGIGGFEIEPYYYTDYGTYRTGVKYVDDPDYVHQVDVTNFKPQTYNWQHANTVNSTATAIKTSETEHILYTTENLEKSNLGSVQGNVTLTIQTEAGKTTTIGTAGNSNTGNVFGGGEESCVTNTPATSTTSAKIHTVIVNLKGPGTTNILGNVFGGGDQGEVEGSTTVNIMVPEN